MLVSKSSLMELELKRAQFFSGNEPFLVAYIKLELVSGIEINWPKLLKIFKLYLSPIYTL